MNPVSALDPARSPGERRRALLRIWGWDLAANLLLTIGIGYRWILAAPPRGGWMENLHVHLALLSQVLVLGILLSLLLVPLLLLVPRRSTLWLAAVPALFLLQVLVLLDTSIYRVFAFHVNGMILNLLMTRGTWDTIHIGRETLLPFGLLVLLLAACEVALAAVLAGRAGAPRPSPARGRVARGFALALLAAVAAEKAIYTGADLVGETRIVRFASLYPLLPQLTVRSLAESLFGYRSRGPEIPAMAGAAGTLRYPGGRLERRPLEGYPNILWVVIDAWRYDMLDPAVTPRLASRARRALVFRNHYSGGNSSRFGVFTLFYGLSGRYWHPFLNEGRGPVLIDELLDLGYQPRIISSTRLTSPEFDRTAFSRIPQAVEDNLGGENASTRDPRAAARLLEWLEGRDPRKPFFAFVWLDAPHSPYSYPDDFALFRPALKKANYLTVGPDQAALLKNGYRNALSFDDAVVGGMLDAMEERGLLEETIVLITGDHGEEFYEAGFLGHTSAFDREQTGVPLLLFAPGLQPGEVRALTSHLDVAPTMLSLLGYTSPPDIYSQGTSLLGGGGHEWVQVSGWDTGALIDDRGAVVFSTETYNSSLFEVRDTRYGLGPQGRALSPERQHRLTALALGFRRFLR